MVLTGCGAGPDPNEEFADAFLEKHLTAPEGYTGGGIPAEVSQSVRDCARPSLIEAANDLSEAEKADILASMAQSMDDSYEMPSAEQINKASEVNSIVAGCLAAAMGAVLDARSSVDGN